MKPERPIAIFDLDGTLYETESVSLPAVRSAVRDLGLEDKDDELIVSLFGYTTPELCRRLFPDAPSELQDRLAAEVRRYERSLIGTHGRLYDGTEDLLASLKRDGWSVALCTNGSATYVETVLNGLFPSRPFDRLFVREEGRTKADRVAEIVGGAGRAAIMIGDRKIDIDAARANSIPSVGALWGYGSRGELEEATFAAKSPSEILPILSRCRVQHELMERLEAKGIVPGKRAVVGINGPDASGKTTFAAAFASFLSAYGYSPVCIHIDDFHNESKARRTGANPIEAYYDNGFNLELLKSEILLPFRDAGSFDAILTLLDLESDTYTRNLRFLGGDGTLLIVEGTLLFREPVDPFFDFRIFLHVPFDEVLRRAEIRDVPKYGDGILDRYRNKYIPVQKLYAVRCRPAERADAVLDNTDFNRPIVVR